MAFTLLLAACSAGGAAAAIDLDTTTALPAPALPAAGTTATRPIAPPTSTGTTRALPSDKDPDCLSRARFGDPADSLYVLPYPVGRAYYLTQSYCAVGTGHHDQLAYDWYMPIGSELVAARGGWVRQTRESNPDNGLGALAENFIYIEHADGSIAFYAHLMQGGVDVEVGQWVDQGEHLGFSGNSGRTRMPHLHFGVYRDWPQDEETGIGVNFRNTDGELDGLGGLLLNRLYQALPWE